MLDGVMHVVRRHLNGEPDPILGQLLDLGLHPAITAEGVKRGRRVNRRPLLWSASQATPKLALQLRLFILTRHAHSTLNVEGRVNGDPAVPVPLTDEGRDEAARLGHQLRELRIDLCVHTRFARTSETAHCVLAGRDVPYLQEPLLDDVKIGDLEGEPIENYRAWKRAHTRADPFPGGGESLDDAAGRYASAFAKLLERDEPVTLVVCHEIPIRYALNAAAGSAELDAPEHGIPNATPYLFDDDTLARAVKGIERIVANSSER